MTGADVVAGRVAPAAGLPLIAELVGPEPVPNASAVNGAYVRPGGAHAVAGVRPGAAQAATDTTQATRTPNPPGEAVTRRRRRPRHRNPEPPVNHQPGPNTPHGTLQVGATDLHVWLLPPPDSPRDVPLGELHPDERRRAAAYRRQEDRQTYAAAHVGMRRVLSVYTGVAPERLTIDREWCEECRQRHGRPVLVDLPGAPEFSLSHSHGLAVVAVARTRVGVDVQSVPSARTVQVCLPSLHPAERQEIDRLPPEQRQLAFGRLWSRKEAYLKGLGTGLARAADIDYLGEAAESWRPVGWTVRNLPLCPSHVAAAALAGDRDWHTSVRPVPAEWLYARDAADRIAAVEPGLRTVLRANDPDSVRTHALIDRSRNRKGRAKAS